MCQLKKGYDVSEGIKKDILNYAKKNLAKYKVPKEIEMLEQLPLTTVGKVDKKVLRQKYQT